MSRETASSAGAPAPGRAAAEEAVKACYASWDQTYHADYYGDAAAYPPVHRTLVLDLLQAAGARSVLDAGCGPASILRQVADAGIEPYGFDLTAGMVDEARRVMHGRGFDAERIWSGSVCDAAAFDLAAHGGPETVDAAMCIGVLPHLRARDEPAVLANLVGAVRTGGLVVVEARNALFALFTMNRYTRDFVLGELLASAPGPLAEATRAGLDGMLRTDQPPLRRGADGDPGYDEVLSRTHNPLVLPRDMAAAGLVDVEVLFYHYHAAPPIFEGTDRDAFAAASRALEDPRDWRGHFMASAFLAVGRRP